MLIIKMKCISFFFCTLLPYLVLAQVKGRLSVSGNFEQTSNFTNYYSPPPQPINANAWNYSATTINYPQQQFANTIYPTFQPYNTAVSRNDLSSPTTTTTLQASNNQNGWNSSILHNQSGNGNYFSPPTVLPALNYNTQIAPGQNVSPFAALPASNSNMQIQTASGNGWNSTNNINRHLGSGAHPQPALPGNGGNSSMNVHSQQLGNAQAYPAFNYNIQTVTATPIFKDRTAEFLNHTRLNIASGFCFTEVPTASLVAGKLNTVAIPRGNGSNPTMSRIQICCDGYQRNPHVFRKCDPICKDDCPNGICTAPNTCVCLPGNIRDHEDNCVPICPIGCRNGICQPNGSCVCKTGFYLDPTSKQFCRPHCSKGCGGVGTCIAPETCRCPFNYELSPSGVCQPKCENCDGTCTAPGVCSCNRGYIRKGNICEPICTKGCFKGTCTAPETCTCKPGFTLDSSKANCVPHCEKPCLNGFCDGYNVCSCNPGYILDATQPNVCKAHCPSGCPNGTCTSPNFCICNKGFRKSGIKGKQNCVPLIN